MAKKCKSPVYNAVGYLPEAQLDILSMALEGGYVVPVGTQTADEQALIEYGYLTPKERKGSMTLCLTPAGKKIAPNVKSEEARWATFSQLAPLIASCIQDNTGSTIQENKILAHGESSALCPTTALLLDCGQIDTAEETYGESYPDEVVALKHAGILYNWNRSAGARSLAAQWDAAAPATYGHAGIIKAISDTEVIQHIGQDRHVVWPRQKLSGVVVEIGKYVDISADGKVKTPRANNNELTM